MLPKNFRNLTLRETAFALTPQQRRLLDDLSDRGPGLLVELAVRQLLLPEQIGAPLNDLRERGLVRGEAFAGGQLGNELYFLTDSGQQTVALLREEVAGNESLRTASVAASLPRDRDPRWYEVDLLQKLGDLAERTGEAGEARQYYKQALDLTRALAEPRERYDPDLTHD